jgi:ABC-2 type transport system ATP-binding protein
MTGRENLLFSGEMNGLSRETARARATALLERVGMTYAADRRTRTYSRGMRQRLGIADVLMKDPDIIIMDEPTLGIDPQGMHELTALIRELSVKDGRTILISSHELYQIQEISDRVGIFVKGKMIACGRIDELGKQLQNEGLYMVDFKAEQPASDANASTEAQQILVCEHLKFLVRSIPGVRLVGQKEDGTIHVESSEDIRRTLFQKLYEDGYVLSELHERGGDLDEIYRKYFEKAEEDEEAKKQEEAAAQETKSLSKKLLSGFRK